MFRPVESFLIKMIASSEAKRKKKKKKPFFFKSTKELPKKKAQFSIFQTDRDSERNPNSSNRIDSARNVIPHPARTLSMYLYILL